MRKLFKHLLAMALPVMGSLRRRSVQPTLDRRDDPIPELCPHCGVPLSVFSVTHFTLHEAPWSDWMHRASCGKCQQGFVRYYTRSKEGTGWQVDPDPPGFHKNV
jgi:hypothetical protein